MTRITAALVLFLMLAAVLAWMANEVGGAGFWYNFRLVTVGLAVTLGRVLIPCLAVTYFIMVMWTGNWSLWFT